MLADDNRQLDSRNVPPDRNRLPSPIDNLVNPDLAQKVKIQANPGDLAHLHLRDVKRGLDAIVDQPDYIKRMNGYVMVKTLNSDCTHKLLEATMFNDIPIIGFG